jgi:ribosomal protein S1
LAAARRSGTSVAAMMGEHVGSVVEATVARIEEYGVYFDFAGGRVLVLIVDVARERIASLNDRFRVGDVVRVKLVKFVAERECYKGSILALDESADQDRSD